MSFLAEFCAEFLIHAVDVEGKQAGIDRELLTLLAETAPIPCVYAGGIHSFDDIAAIQSVGGGKSIIPSALPLTSSGDRFPTPLSFGTETEPPHNGTSLFS